MRFKFAYAVSIAAAVAMATACGKKDEGEASKQATAASSVAASAPTATASAAPAASEATVVKIGHAAPLTGTQAHLGQDNENGARLALEEISAQGLTIDGPRSISNSTARTPPFRAPARKSRKSLWMTTWSR